MIESYDIVTARDLGRLSTAVNAAIGTGKQPFGAPFINLDGAYAQTMVVMAEEEPEEE